MKKKEKFNNLKNKMKNSWNQKINSMLKKQKKLKA